VRINHEGGTCSDSWECADCKTKFWPHRQQPPAKDAYKEVHNPLAGQFNEQQPPATEYIHEYSTHLPATDASDHSEPPATEQGWTVDESPPNGMRGRIMIPNRLPIVHWRNDSIDLKAICDAHNAAVTAHEQAWLRVRDRIADEYAQDMIMAKVELDAHAKVELDAHVEREQWKLLIDGQKRAICGKCGYPELVGSDDCRNCSSNFNHQISYGDKHDAEVRKPLVDALTFIRDNAKPGSVIQAMASDALALRHQLYQQPPATVRDSRPSDVTFFESQRSEGDIRYTETPYQQPPATDECTCGNLGPEQGIPSPLCKIHGKAWEQPPATDDKPRKGGTYTCLDCGHRGWRKTIRSRCPMCGNKATAGNTV
jgi:rubrerythrin